MPPTTDKAVADVIESNAWLQLDVADYLRMSRPMTPVDKRGRDVLRRKITKQLKRQEQHGDPLEVVDKVQQLMEEGK